MASTRRLYVYYKLPADERAAWLPGVRAFLALLAARHPGLEAELLRRPAASAEGLETWMEVFRHPDGVDEALQQQIQQAAAEQGLPQPRAAEVFVGMADLP